MIYNLQLFAYNGNSIVDYLNSQGKDSSFSARKKLAEDMGISNYSGTANQNTQLLKALQNGNSANKNTTNQNTTNTTNTTDNNNNKNLPLGVSQEQLDKTQGNFVQSKNVTNLGGKASNAYSIYEALANKENIISNSTTNEINSNFKVPSAVTEADAYLAELLKKIQSGKTSYSDQVKEMMDKIMNREKFSYDVDADPLFQQALASAMNSGKQAMQDTIGQSSALTGGYGSTYATSAGNQAYNAFIEDAYNNLPQYYQMALEAYQMEGDEMYRQFGMVSELDDKEYNRNVTAYDATYQHRNQLYNEAYTQFRDNKSDAFASANLQLNEYGQRVSNAYNLYNAAFDQEKTMYDREYLSWKDSIENAWKEIDLYHNDAWTNKNFEESVRQYEKTFAEQQRQYNETLAEQKRQHNEQMSYNWASLNKKSSSGGGGGSGSLAEFIQQFDSEEDAKEALNYARNSSNVKSFQSNLYSEEELARREWTVTIDGKKRRFDNRTQYIEAALENRWKQGDLTDNETVYLKALYGID